MLQRHILELKPLEGMFLKAGNIAKNGKAPSSIDLLKIQRHILNLQKIDQTSNNIINNIQTKPNTETIKLEISKETVKQGEEFSVTMNAENFKVSAYDINLHFDSNKLELISEAKDINVEDNNIIYTWFDENGGKNISKNKELAKFNFKAKEDGVNNFSLEGNFYNEKENLVTPKIEVAEVKIGEINEKENTSNENQNETNIVQSNDKNNTNLAILRLNKPGIVPNFSEKIKEYYINVNESINDLEITAVPENSNSKIDIIGNKNLKTGLNTIIIKVTSENNQNETEYKIYVTKTSNEETANAQLETLAIENQTLEHNFIENITDYTAQVDNNVKSLNILAIPQNENAKVTIEGANDLKVGDNTVIVTVIAENEVTFKKYKITVHRRNEQEQKEEEYKQNNVNIKQVSLIDNSKQIIDKKQENMQIKSENSLLLVGGILLIILVSGIVIIRIFKKK